MNPDQEVVIVDDAGNEHVFPAGFDPVKAAGIVRASQQPAASHEAQPSSRTPVAGRGTSFNQAQATKNFAALLPVAGGMLGGAAGATGGPAGAYAGSAAGTAAGDTLSRLISGRPVTAGGVATAAAEGAIGEGVGRVAGKAIQAGGRLLGRTVVRGTLRPSAALKREFGGSRAIADTVLDERLMTAHGAEKAVGESSSKLQGMLQQAADAGAKPVRAEELWGDLEEAMATAEKRTKLGLPDQSDEILSRLAAIERRNPSGIPFLETQDLKKEAQSLAREAYKAREAGRETTSLTAEVNEGVASGLQHGVESHAADVGFPGVRDVNARTQRLMGAERAMREAEDRPNALTNLLSIATASHNPATGAAMRGLGSSRVGTAAGVGINELSKIAGNPQLLKAALLAQLLNQDQQQP